MNDTADAERITPPGDLLQRVRETILREGMLTPGKTVVVAVSGGPDSVALLHILCELSSEESWNIVAAHLNHGFRGEESDGDAAYVAELAAKLAIPAHIEHSDVPAMRRRRHLSSQEAARIARHGFLRRVAQQVGADRIALGHTADDRLETVLLNLFRGTGLEGLAGFPAVQFPLIRPLYAVRRAETHAYCAAHDLQPRKDSSNDNLSYRRNRLRAELLPNLTTYYNERVDEAILRMADLASEENALLEALATGAQEHVVILWEADHVHLDSRQLQLLPKPLQRRLLRQTIRQVRGHLQQVPFETIERILNVVATNGNATEQLATADYPVSVQVDGARVQIGRECLAATPLAWQAELPLPGTVHLLPAGVHVTSEKVPTALAALQRAESLFRNASENVSGIAIMPVASLELPLRARSWRPGDRFRPRGLGGEKKLQDLFVDRKVPNEQRARIPVVVDANDQILCVGVLHSEERVVLMRPERGVVPDSVEWSAETVLLLWESKQRKPEQPS